MKRGLSILLTLAMLINMVPVAVFAEDPVQVTLTADKTELAAGEEVVLTLSIDQTIEKAYIWQWNIMWNSDLFEVVSMAKGTVYEHSAVNESATIALPNPYIASSVTSGDFAFPHTLSAGILCTLTLRAKVNINQTANAGFYANCDKVQVYLNDQAEDYTNITTSYDWGNDYNTLPDGNAEALTLTVRPAAGTEPDPGTANFTVYYEIPDTEYIDDADRDGFVEPAEFNTEVAVDVYIKADTTTTLQAFDIYPKWDSMLTYVSIAGANGVVIETSEMIAAKPHFYAVGTEDGSLNLSVDATGVKIATLTMRLRDSAESDIVYGQHYGLYFDGLTNAAQKMDDESVPVTVDTTGTMGFETLKTYTVTYAPGTNESVTGMPGPQTKQHNAEFALNATGPVRTGYNFLGWSTNKNATEAQETYAENADVTVYAVWSQQKFTVTWNSEDGETLLETDTDVVYGTAPSFDKNDPTKEKSDEFTYTFAGWATAPNQTSGTLEADLPKVTGNVNYYAVFTSATNKYDVTFNMNGHGDQIPTQSIEYNKTAAQPAPTVAGYTFGGWYTDAACENAFSFETPIKSNTTLYAKWTANAVKVTLNAAGGKINDEDSIEIEVTFDSKYTGLVDPVRNGYTFDGWYIGETEITAETTVSTADTHVLTAKWSVETYTITYDTNGGDLPAGVDNTLQYTTEDNDKLPAPTKTGATFDGWKPEKPQGSWNDSSYSAETSVQGKYGSVTLVAQWSTNAYTIGKVENAGGTVTPSKNSANFNDTITVTVKPVDGWQITGVYYTVGDAGQEVPVEQTEGVYTFAMPAANIKVGAHFEKITYSVTVNASTNGRVTASKGTAQVGDEITLTVTPGTGYELSSLTVSWDGGNVTVTDNKFAMPAGEVTVTATFAVKQFTITFKDGDTVLNTITQDFGSNIGAVAEPTKTGYTFAGWDKTIPSTMPAEDMTITATWTANTYNVTLNADGGAYADGYTAPSQYTYNQPLTLPDGTQITKAGYTFGGWFADSRFSGTAVTEIAAGQIGDKAFYAKWNPNTYTITFNKEDGTPLQAVEFTFGAASIQAPAVPEKAGYTGEWESYDLSNPSNQTVKPVYTAVTYTITLDANGGTVDPTTITYKITDTVTLPTAVKGLYAFKGWKVTATDAAGWELNSVIEAGKVNDTRYGNVTLEAQWEFALNYVVEDYKYAADGYVMLRIAGDGSNTNAYEFGDSKMYYSAENSYTLGGNGVFFTLIEKTYAESVTGDDGKVTYTGKLTAAGIEKLSRTEEAAATISYNGDVNGDGKVNIADANAVYQMVQNGGSYYSGDQLSIPERLKADMDRTSAGDAHGSIADVEAIVTLINAAANTQ